MFLLALKGFLRWFPLEILKRLFEISNSWRAEALKAVFQSSQKKIFSKLKSSLRSIAQCGSKPLVPSEHPMLAFI